MGNTVDDSRYAEIIARSAKIELEQKGFAVIPAGTVESFTGSRSIPEDPEEFQKNALPALLENAAKAGSGFVMVILYHGDAASATFTVFAWNNEGKRITVFKDRVRSGLELYTRMSVAADEFASGAGKVQTSGTTTTTTTVEGGKEERGFVQQIVFYSWDEGAEIYVNKVIRAGVIVDGRLTLPYMPMPLNSKLVVEKRKNGYYPNTEEFSLDGEWMELRLSPLEKISSHEGVFLYGLGQFAGFGIGYYNNLIPKMLFIGAENYFYIQFGSSTESNPVFHDDIRLLVGIYLLSDPNVPIRLNLSTGAGVIFTFLSIPDSPVYTDFYFNLVNITLEFRAWNAIVFLREEFKLGLGLGDNILGQKFFLVAGRISPITFGMKMPM